MTATGLRGEELLTRLGLINQELATDMRSVCLNEGIPQQLSLWNVIWVEKLRPKGPDERRVDQRMNIAFCHK
jgi:hypothetical protein